MVIAAATRSCKLKWENQMKNLTLKIMLVTVCALAALPISAHARNCQATGSTVFCDDGVSYQRSGNTTFGSDEVPRNALAIQLFVPMAALPSKLEIRGSIRTDQHRRELAILSINPMERTVR